MKKQCCGQVCKQGSYRPCACQRNAKFEYEGQMYCGTHHPPTVKARDKARSAKWDAKWDAMERNQMTTLERLEKWLGGVFGRSVDGIVKDKAGTWVRLYCPLAPGTGQARAYKPTLDAAINAALDEAGAE